MFIIRGLLVFCFHVFFLAIYVTLGLIYLPLYQQSIVDGDGDVEGGNAAGQFKRITLRGTGMVLGEWLLQPMHDCKD